MTIPGKTVYLLKFHLSQDIIICTQGGSRTHNLWIRSPTRLSIAPRRYIGSDMIEFSIYISCYNFPIIIAYFNCILKIYSSENVTWLPWRHWLARSAVNRKVGGSSPPGSDFLSISRYNYTSFYTIIISEVMAVWIHSTWERNINKKSGPDAIYSPI